VLGFSVLPDGSFSSAKPPASARLVHSAGLFGGLVSKFVAGQSAMARYPYQGHVSEFFPVLFDALCEVAVSVGRSGVAAEVIESSATVSAYHHVARLWIVGQPGGRQQKGLEFGLCAAAELAGGGLQLAEDGGAVDIPSRDHGRRSSVTEALFSGTVGINDDGMVSRVVGDPRFAIFFDFVRIFCFLERRARSVGYSGVVSQQKTGMTFPKTKVPSVKRTRNITLRSATLTSEQERALSQVATNTILGYVDSTKSTANANSGTSVISTTQLSHVSNLIANMVKNVLTNICQTQSKAYCSTQNVLRTALPMSRLL
jgi:hypothetical protein